jgi:peroxiredoxin
MKELTLSEILAEAFERSRDLDAPLSGRLEMFADAVRMASPQFAEAVDRLVTRLTLSGCGAAAPAVGEAMPPFMLPDDHGRLVTLDQLLANGPVAVSFHRGHWCPYCRINTNALAEAQCEVEPIGGQIIAITPDLQHFTMALRDDAGAKQFPILTDIDNGYALSLNLAIFVGREMRNFMTHAGWDIAPYQGNDAWMLPIPATFVLGRDGIIRARFVDPDYRRRMAIEVIVDAMRAAANEITAANVGASTGA